MTFRDMEEFKEFMRRMIEDAMKLGDSPRSCQRCEEQKQEKDFSSPLPVCDACVHSMPDEELKWLAEEVRGNKS